LGCTVAELLQRIGSRELTEWMAFYRMEPFGFEADLYGHAVTAASVYNVNRPKGRKAVSPLDFLPREAKERRVEPHSIFQAFKDMAVMMGAKKK
jgi:hypothetical protein